MINKKPLSCAFNPQPGGTKGVFIGSNDGLSKVGGFNVPQYAIDALKDETE